MGNDRTMNRKVFLASAGASLAALLTVGGSLFRGRKARPEAKAARAPEVAALRRDPRSIEHQSHTHTA